MDIEHTEANAEGTAVTNVTDAALDAAAENQEEEKESQQVESETKEELTPEQKAQVERSRLGRRQAQRVDKLEQELLETRRQHNELMELISNIVPKLQPNHPAQAPVQEEDLDRPLTRREWEQLEAQKRRSEVEQQTNYQKSYQRTLNAFRSQNPDLHEEVVAEKMKNFNVIVTGNPELDAEFNYNRAMASVLKKKSAAPRRQVPVNGGTEAVPTGLSGTSRVKPSELPKVQLDPEAQELMNYLASKGKDTKWASETLTGEIPLNLLGKRK
jgi:hypothetical protein